jgi:hypothetical protein
MLRAVLEESRLRRERPHQHLAAPGNDLTFHFAGSRAPVLNRQWLAALRAEADSPGGLVLGDKTAEPTPVGVPVSGIDQRVP